LLDRPRYVKHTGAADPAATLAGYTQQKHRENKRVFHLKSPTSLQGDIGCVALAS
jgi:hypothetical protein